MESAGCVTAQASAARPKWSSRESASKYLSCFNVTDKISFSYSSNNK
jgi:hypothetical protein